MANTSPFTTSFPDTSECLLSEYWPSEQRAILVHRFYLGVERKRPIALSEAVASWETGPAHAWRAIKARRDGERQTTEIARHKWLLSKRLGRDVGWDFAAEDWCLHHARTWRDWWEQQPEAGA